VLPLHPTYIALGPIYETQTKALAYAPQGLRKISQWKEKIGFLEQESACPLVTIGGITLENVAEVLAAGADSVAVVGALVPSRPEETLEAIVSQWLPFWDLRRRSQSNSHFYYYFEGEFT
jgi:thiamine-phosphate pyrophosphorylase